MNTDNDLLMTIARDTSRLIGKDFLERLVNILRNHMNAIMVVLTERPDPNSTIAKTILARVGDQPVENFEYDLVGTPCEAVYQGRTYVVANDLSVKFDVDKNRISYIGVPVFENDQVFAHLAVISDKPLTNPEMAESIIQIFAGRAEAEIRRIKYDREKDSLLQELEKANKRMTSNYQKLRAINEYKTQILGMVAHDLKNPLGQVLGFSQLLSANLKSASPDQNQIHENIKMIQLINNAGNQMLDQIKKILDDAQNETAEMPLNLEEINIFSFLKQVIQMNSIAADRKKIQLRHESNKEIFGYVDPELLVEALDNLISNAIKYSYPESEILIYSSQNENELLVHVKDQGQGMSEEDIKFAFQRFKRLSAAPTAGEDSVGLGLYNVKLIMERHGGNVSVSSEGKNKGSVFTLSFPMNHAL